MTRVEVLTLAPLVGLTLLLGLYPGLVLHFIQRPVDTRPGASSSARDHGAGPVTQNEWLAIAPFLIVSGLARAHRHRRHHLAGAQRDRGRRRGRSGCWRRSR